MKFFFLLLFIPFLLFGANPDFDVEMSVDKQKTAIGEIIILKTSFKQLEGYQTDIPSLIEQLLWTANPSTPRFVLRQSMVSPDKSTLKLVLEPLALGTQYLTFLSVTFRSKKGTEPVVVPSPVIQLEITPAEPPGLLSLAPLHPLMPELPLNLTSANRQALIEDSEVQAAEAARNQLIISRHSFPWFYLFSFLFVLAGWWGTQRFLHYREEQRRAKLEAASARILAEQALQMLRSQSLIEQKKYKEYFSALATIVLNYLEMKYKLLWYALTTNELSQLQPNNPAEKALKEELVPFLSLADQVKFAEYIPSRKEVEQADRIAEDLIQN